MLCFMRNRWKLDDDDDVDGNGNNNNNNNNNNKISSWFIYPLAQQTKG
jgi:hypothetical protein